MASLRPQVRSLFLRSISGIAVLFFLTLSPLWANSLSTAPIEKIPSPDDIVAFTNGLPAATGVRATKSRREIEIFLSQGTHAKKDPSPADLANAVNTPPEGIFTDRSGTFYFWRLLSPTTLHLLTPQGGSAILTLPQDATAP